MGETSLRSHGEGDEGDEGDEAREQGGEGQGYAEERDLRCDRGFLRVEEEGGEVGLRELGVADPDAAEGDGEVHHPRGDDDQAEEEARDEGREADGLREGGLCEGEAREDAGEVLHGEGAQGQLLSCSSSPRLADMGDGACSWRWGFPAACLSDGRSGHTGRPNILKYEDRSLCTPRIPE